MNDNFSEAPPSIGEIRAAKEEDCSKWTPRDALVSVLRDIDSGKVNCKALVVCYTIETEKGSNTVYAASSPDAITALGMLSRVTHILNMSSS